MKKAGIILILFFSCIHVSGQVSNEQKISTKEFLNALESNTINYLEEFGVPGAAICVIEGGEIILQKGFGYANVNKKTPVKVSTGFNIGSISKTLTAWGVMKLVQEGKIDLDSPAEKYLTRWHLPTSEFDVNKITIRRLLSHTAGISLHGYPGWSKKDSLPTLEESLSGNDNGAGEIRVIHEPGVTWEYSGGGYTILQLIIEEVSGKDFATYMQDAILAPLEMHQSSFQISERILNASSLEYNEYGEVIDFELFTAKAAAGFQTTINDFSKFALANFSNTVLSPENVALMQTPVAVSNGTYGLGYQIDSIPGSSTVLRGHSGANAGWHALFKINSDTQDGLIVLTNGGTGHHLYNQVFCEWIQWKTALSFSQHCLKSFVPLLWNDYKVKGSDSTIEKYNSLKKHHIEEYVFDPGQLINLGFMLLEKEAYSDALKIFTLNSDEYPPVFWNYYFIAQTYEKLGELDLALSFYQKALEINPNHGESAQKVELLRK